MGFKDHFSAQAAQYGLHRPRYPPELAGYLAALAQAMAHPRVQYLRHPAERLPVAGGTADLVAVAQAAHWLDLPRFYAEARRALRPGGILALWTYSNLRVESGCDAVLDRFYCDRVGAYWPVERRHVEAGYRTLPFPLTELHAPAFELSGDWSLERVVAYVGTWSAVARCRAADGADPLPALAGELSVPWAGAPVRPVRWPLHLRLGRFVPI